MKAQVADSTAFLIGTWKIDYDCSFSHARQTVKDHLNSLNADQLQRVKSNYNSKRYTFNDAGDFLVELAGNSVSGTWNLESSGSVLAMAYATGVTLKYTLEDRDSSSMRLRPSDGKSEALMLKELCLIKP